MKETNSVFRSYLNKEKVCVSQASLGLVDARLIGIFLEADPNLTFRDDLKQAIMVVMADGAHISIFPKRVKDPSNYYSKICFANGLAVQVAIPDSKKAVEYMETLAKAMEYLNGNESHPILSSKVFIPFGKAEGIDDGTFRKLIRMQNEYLHKIKHIEINSMCNIDKEISITIQQERCSTHQSGSLSWTK
jgi:hypothetical protein